MQSIAASNLEAVVHVSILECREHSLPVGDRVCAVLALTWASVGQGELVRRHSVHTVTLSGRLVQRLYSDVLGSLSYRISISGAAPTATDLKG